ncbi:hypothetical protein [Xanthomonas bonasiae]|uniref:hypothetical protein n=1 Tax=Xanthomonas bonasiae TaxID=2810351 RepID=UPI001CD8D3EA|nr:hypothetical protein [Xanthomonas surreyensis]
MPSETLCIICVHALQLGSAPHFHGHRQRARRATSILPRRRWRIASTARIAPIDATLGKLRRRAQSSANAPSGLAGSASASAALAAHADAASAAHANRITLSCAHRRRDDLFPLGVPMTSPTLPPYSGLGIASFAVSLIAAVLTLVLIGVCAALVYSQPDSLDEDSPLAMLVGMAMMVGVFAELAAAALGIGSLFQRDRRKLYGVLGLIFAIATLVGVAALIVFGLIQGS